MIFASMIEEYGVPIKAEVEAAGGYYKQGDWIPAVTASADVLAVLLPFKEDTLRYSEAGTYSEKDRRLFTLVYLKLGQTIFYKGVRYTVQQFKDLTDYTDVKIYVARWAGSENG